MLRQLKLNVQLRESRAKLEQLTAKRDDFNKRAEELEAALDEAKTEEDINTVKSEIEALEKEKGDEDIDKEIGEVETKISEIEGELADIAEKEKQANEQKASESENTTERRTQKMNVSVRRLVETGEYFERSEVKKFYNDFKDLVQRKVQGEDLTIPNIVINRIFDIMGDYCTVYPLVDKINVSGTTRILIDTDTTAAEWMEMKGTLPDGDVGTITNIDFDGFKVGKVVFIDNCIIQDSIINVDAYVVKKLARAIGLAVDAAILSGEGSAQKQPEGIITKLSAEHKVTVPANCKLVDILKNIALVDTGKDSVGIITAVMNRQTYYNRFLEYTINVDSNGNVVGKLPNLTKPDLCGLPVVFNNNLEEGQVLFGDFLKYTLVQREALAIANSDAVKFAEDQMAFRGKARFDGKPVKSDAFVLVTIEDE